MFYYYIFLARPPLKSRVTSPDLCMTHGYQNLPNKGILTHCLTEVKIHYSLKCISLWMKTIQMKSIKLFVHLAQFVVQYFTKLTSDY